jgi:hypothetical protein
MNPQDDPTTPITARATPLSSGQRFIQWIQDPMGSVIAASVATIGSFGVVLSGMWAISLALN